MPFRVRPVRGQFNRHGVDLFLQFILDTVELLRQHLVAFGDDLQLVLKVFGKDSDVLFKVLIDFLAQ